MITGVLNTLLTASTQDFDTKLDKSEKRVTKFGQTVQQAGAGVNISQAFGGFSALSGLGVVLSGPLGRVTATAGLIGQIVTGISSQVSIAQANLAASSMKAASAIEGTGTAAASAGANVGFFGRMIGMLANPVGIAIGIFAAFTAATVGAGLALHAMASHGAAQITELYDTANNLDLSSSALTAFSLAPGLRGIEDVASNLGRLQGTLGNLGADGRAVLDRMQIDLDELSSVNAEQQIRLLADGYQRLEGQTERAGALRTLFGRGGMAMMDLLEGGIEGLDNLTARAERLGLTFSDSQALALRRANIEWSGFGLALQGIGRQAAILFTPMWESIGRIGGAIGEWIVEKFRQAMPMMTEFGRLILNLGGAIWQLFGGGFIEAAIGDMWPGITEGIRTVIVWTKILFEVTNSFLSAFNAGMRIVWQAAWQGLQAFWNLLARVFVPQFIRDWIAEFTGGWTGIQDFALTALASIVVAMEQPRLAWDALKAAGIMAWETLKVKVAEWAEVSLSSIRRVVEGMRATLGNPNSQAGIYMLNQATRIRGMENEAVRMGIEAQARVDRLVNAPDAALQNFGGRVNNIVARWQNEIRGLFGGPGAAQPGAPAAPTPWARQQAITGHEAATADSQRAFSLQYGTRGNAEMYARMTAVAVERSAREAERMRMAMERAPVIRRANLR